MANKTTLEELNNLIFPQDYTLDFSKDVWWVATCDNKPVGFCGLAEFRNYVFLKRAGVLSDYRGRRLHRHLIRVRLQYAKKLGFEQAITYTLINNTASSNNLIQAGFRLYLPENRWVGNDALYWVKWL